MKKFSIFVLKLGQAVVGLIALYSLVMLLLHNEPIELFTFENAGADILNIVEQKHNICLVTYQYKGNYQLIVNKEHIIKRLLYENGQVVNLNIAYNKTFPSINRINDFTLYNGYYIGLAWGLLMLTIFILVDLFADKDKWAERYRRFFGFP